MNFAADVLAGDKVREQREEEARAAQNRKHAAGAYTSPEPEHIGDDREEGPPWGGISMRHVLEASRWKGQGSKGGSPNFEEPKSLQGSREAVDAAKQPGPALWKDRGSEQCEHDPSLYADIEKASDAGKR